MCPSPLVYRPTAELSKSPGVGTRLAGYEWRSDHGRGAFVGVLSTRFPQVMNASSCSRPVQVWAHLGVAMQSAPQTYNLLSLSHACRASLSSLFAMYCMIERASAAIAATHRDRSTVQPPQPREALHQRLVLLSKVLGPSPGSHRELQASGLAPSS